MAGKVLLPPPKSRKQVYVALSSDEEDQEQQNPEGEETIVDPSALTDDDLKAALLAHGVNVGPIVASTRTLYENKLRRILQPAGQRVDAVLKSEECSDSEDQESEEEEERKAAYDGQEEQQKLGSGGTRQTKELACKKVQPQDQGAYVYPQCFMPSSRLQTHAFKTKERTLKQNSGNALKSSALSGSTFKSVSRTSPEDPPPGKGLLASSARTSNGSTSSGTFFTITQMVKEMETKMTVSSVKRESYGSSSPEHSSQPSKTEAVKMDESVYHTPKFFLQQDLKESMKHRAKHSPGLKTVPFGIYATPRPPIWGAAKRSVLSGDPNLIKPGPRARLEVDLQVVPVHIQFVVFLLLSAVLYLIYLVH